MEKLCGLDVENDRTGMIAEGFWPRCTRVPITGSCFYRKKNTNVQYFHAGSEIEV